MVSAMVMASSWSWVTWMKVRPTSLLDPLELDLHLPAQLEVEGAERLVEQQHVRAVDQGPRERDALLLAAGELVRLALLPTWPSSTRSRASCDLAASRSLSPRRRSPKATFSTTSCAGRARSYWNTVLTWRW